MYGFGDYLSTSGAAPSPGTTLIEHWGGSRGVGKYVPTPNYFLTPAGQAGVRGLGCLCGTGPCSCGMSGLFGTSLFESSSPADWGVGEWASIVVGGFVLFSVFDTTKRGTRAARRKGKAVKKALAA